MSHWKHMQPQPGDLVSLGTCTIHADDEDFTPTYMSGLINNPIASVLIAKKFPRLGTYGEFEYCVLTGDKIYWVYYVDLIVTNEH